MSETATIGDNNPPADPGQSALIERLDELYEALFDRQMDLELASAKLPKEVKSDDDVAKINEATVARRALAHDFEEARKYEKEPYLNRSREVDAHLGGPRDALLSAAKSIESRNGPYLLAKRRKAEADAAAAAAAARAAADKAKQEAASAAQRGQEADDQRAAAEQRLRDAENVSRETIAPSDGGTVQSLEPEEGYRTATLGAQHAQAESEEAQIDADRAELAAQRLERAMDGPSLGKTQGGGASAKADLKWVAHVSSWPLLLQSLGPLGQYFRSQWVEDALARAAANGQPAVPGVVWREEVAVKTTVTRR